MPLRRGQRHRAGCAGGVEKTDIAAAGAARAIEALAENDEVGVLAFNTQHEWLIDLQRLPSEEVVDEGLGRLVPAGGTDLREQPDPAAEALRESHAGLRHIILFTDGFTATNVLDDLADEAAALDAEGITVSVIATGEGAAEQLEAVAEAGGGRFYPGRDLQEIPQLMMEETILASRDFVNEGQFLPTVTSSSAVVRELTESPPLLGYVATTAKAEAEVLLRIGPDHDPLLATWQVGLGRVTSWTSDASDRWSQLWAGWDGYVGFWSRVVKDTFGTSSPLGVRARVDGGVLRVTVEQEDAVRRRRRGHGPRRRPVARRSAAPARAHGAGDVRGRGAGRRGRHLRGRRCRAGTRGATALGSTIATLSYAPEYEPGEPDEEALAGLSATTDGRGAIDPAQAFDVAGLEPGRARIALAGWLLLAAALLWPFAVALSRLALRGAGAAAVRRKAAWVGWAARSTWSRRPERPDKPPRPQPRPAKPVTARERREQTVTAETTATVGRLLDRKRERAAPEDPP